MSIFFIHLESRRILFAACTESPDSGWVTQQGRNLTWELTDLGLRPRFLIRDRDAKFAAAFDTVLAAEGTEVRRTPRGVPWRNSIAERWVASARREALDWLLVVNERHLRCIPKEYVEYYTLHAAHNSQSTLTRYSGRLRRAASRTDIRALTLVATPMDLKSPRFGC